MRLSKYERSVQREIEAWQHGDSSLITQAMSWAMAPMDWVVKKITSPDLLDQVDSAISQFLGFLNDASKWTCADRDFLRRAKEMDLSATAVDDLRDLPLEHLDPLARSWFVENTLLAAIEGGGTGLGGAVFIAADIPLLFTINLRLIQQIGASYGFPMD